MIEKIRFGLVGTSAITDWFLEGARLDDRFEAVACYSRNWERGADFVRRHGIRLVFTSLEEMAMSPDVDAIYIASPNNRHAIQAMKCMNYGKHVLCEKPLASNEREARMMISTARRNGVLLMEAMISTLNPNFRIVHDNLPRVGKPCRYTSGYCQYSGRYERFLAGEIPNVFNPEFSGGALMDVGIYTVYPMVALFGRPDEIKANGVILPSGVDSQGSIFCRYGDMEATLSYSKTVNSYVPTEIAGDKGNLLLDEIHALKDVTFIPRPKASSGRDSTREMTDLSCLQVKDLYYYEVKEFIDILECGSRESLVNSHDNTLTTLAVMDEARKQMGVRFPADFTIVEAQRNDAQLIGEVVVTAVGRDLAREFAGNKTVDDVVNLFAALAAADNSQYSYRNTLKAVDTDGKPMGFIIGYDGGDMLRLREAFYEKVKQMLGRDMRGHMGEETGPGEFYLDSLAVFPQYRGRGVASALIDAMAQRGNQKGLPVGLLCDKANATARHLYESLGFKIVGKRMFADEMMFHMSR